MKLTEDEIKEDERHKKKIKSINEAISGWQKLCSHRLSNDYCDDLIDESYCKVCKKNLRMRSR